MFQAKALKAVETPIHFDDKYDLLNLTLCEKEGPYHNLECIDRTCKKCGVDKLKAQLMATEVSDGTNDNLYLVYYM